MFKMRILKDYEFSVLLSDIEEMGEYFIPSRESVPEKGQIIAFVTGKLARVASFKVIRQLTPLDSSSHRIQVALINHYPYGLRLPKKKLLDSKDAADWMILIHDAFRVTARRMNIPRQICHQEGARSKFLYRNDDIWEAAVSIRTPEHRLNRINEREKNFHMERTNARPDRVQEPRTQDPSPILLRGDQGEQAVRSPAE